MLVRKCLTDQLVLTWVVLAALCNSEENIAAFPYFTAQAVEVSHLLHGFDLCCPTLLWFTEATVVSLVTWHIWRWRWLISEVPDDFFYIQVVVSVWVELCNSLLFPHRHHSFLESEFLTISTFEVVHRHCVGRELLCLQCFVMWCDFMCSSQPARRGPRKFESTSSTFRQMYTYI